MNTVLRHVLLLAISAAASWWLFLHAPASVVQPLVIPDIAPAVAVTPRIEAPEPVAAPEQPLEVAEAETAPAEPETPELAPEPETEPNEIVAVEPPEVEEETVVEPPPPELGTHEGEGELAAAADADQVEETEELEDPATQGNQRSEDFMADTELVEEARLEVSGEARKGFATVLLAAPEEQLEIARFFDEELVLVPRRALGPSAADGRYFRIAREGRPRVESVGGAQELQRFRQYRDLFDYEYARLPEALRSLRRSVLSRAELFLFAALIPPSEWAVVIGRRRSALAQAERDLSEVERFIMRYVRRPKGGFDIRVEEIAFADGTRFRPSENP